MSAHGHADGVFDGHTFVNHQFEDRGQQDESYIVGMWTFLVTEVMFFGVLFLGYAVYRYTYPDVFIKASQELSVGWGFINTLILLASSLFVAFSIRCYMLRDKRMTLVWLGLTLLCAFGFLVVKTIEYKSKFDHHLVPGRANFQFPPHSEGHTASASGEHMGGEAHATGAGEHGNETGMPQPGEPRDQSVEGAMRNANRASSPLTAPQNYDVTNNEELNVPLSTTIPVARGAEQSKQAQLFFGLYFIMTGLHALHVIIGILILGTMWVMIFFDHPALADFIPLEMGGLYWHFVDVVWIFLYPFLYLIHPHWPPHF